MPNGNKLYEATLPKLNAFIKARELRVTPVRKMILEQVCLLPQPFTAEQLARACAGERISVGSVYNTLALFIEAQIVHAIKRQRGSQHTEYELMTGTTNRMQVICQLCGRRTAIHDKPIDRLVRERKYSNFNLQHYTIFIYGECKHCRKRKITE